MKKFFELIQAKNKLVMYFFSLLLIGVASSSIYWPSGLLIVGGLMWLDLFLTDLIGLLKIDYRRHDEDVRSR